jgi:hypothetical protein
MLILCAFLDGLWPDHCDGTYDSSCDSKRAYTNISSILTAAGKSDLVDYMNNYVCEVLHLYLWGIDRFSTLNFWSTKF